MNFDAGFLCRLKQRDPDACACLVSVLTPVLEARLRCKLRDRDSIADICHETVYRVFRLVDRGRVREPEKLGGFARGVCDRVAQEAFRKIRGTEPLPVEIPDRRLSSDKLLIEKERNALLWREVTKLSAVDRSLIVERHYEERGRGEMARDRGISIACLNVRLCRALKRLRASILQPQNPIPSSAFNFGTAYHGAPPRRSCSSRYAG